jgi:hypothetical protein
MSRLPTPGSDDDIWGNILNDFLSVELNKDGTLKRAGDIAEAKAKADTAVQPGSLAAVATTGSYTDLANLPAIPAIHDATTSSKGIVKLAGDLAGTADVPLVPGLDAKIDKSAKGQPDGVAGLDSSGKVVPGQLQAANITKILPYSFTGILVTSVGTFRLYNDTGADWTIQAVRASVGTAPTGAAILIDVNVNDTTIFTTQTNRPAIADGANTSGRVSIIDVTAVAQGAYLTIDIDQVGSSSAGENLTVQVEVF